MGRVNRNKVRRQHALRLLVEVDPLEARSLITESLGVAYSIAQLGSFRAGVFTNDPVVSKPPITSPVAKKTASLRPSGVPTAIPTASAPEAPATPVLVPSSPPAMQTPTGTEAEPDDDGFVAPPSMASPGGGSAARGPVGAGQALSSPTSTPASRHAPEADNPASALSATTGVALNSPVAGRNTSSSSASALAPAAANTSISLTSAYAPIAPATARRPVATPMLSSLSFTNFPLYTLDYNNGETLLPGASQYANLNGYVDLRAQTKSATGVTFSWNTSGLADAKNITGASTYRLQFQWKNFSSGATDTVTLTATDSGGHQETQTYSFIVPSGSVFLWSSAPSISWPESISPDQALADTARFDSQNLSVDAYSGSVQTAIALPSYNPNVAPLVFSYDSLNADPRPMILEHHELDPSQSVPTKVGAQLTFNGVTGTTYYYATSAFSGGDIMQMALQGDATSLATGRYDYSIAVSDVRGSTTTTTASGTMTVLNGSSNAVGAGWTLNGLERITAASGGLILDLGSGDKSLWFSGSGTGTYTSPAGEFSTLVKNYDNTYTRTLTDGVAIHYDTSGREVSVTDLNSLTTTYAYDGGGRVSSVTDPYGQTTTLTYDGSGKLATATDPATRVTTFTHSGSKLSGVTLPDSSAWSFAYDSANRLTGVVDPRSKTVTVTLDAAGRASSVARPDGASESFAPYQKQGYDTSGTSGSPAAATLLAESKATYTDPNSGTTDHRVDWRGQGLTNQLFDAAGNVTTLDRDSNGLATVTIDRLNRASLATYDSQGNPTQWTYPDQNYEQYSYSSYSRVNSVRNARGYTTYISYDSYGNPTVVTDAQGNAATLTYTATGQVATTTDARNLVTTYQYDSYDRLTTITFADNSSRSLAYDTQGNVSGSTDELGHTTTYSYDPVNRLTGTTDPLGNRTTYVYDVSGNLATLQAPLSRTTTYTYDSMNRLTGVIDALGHTTSFAYDAIGNMTRLTDPLSRTTTHVYDSLNRETVLIDPLGNRTTTAYDAEGDVTSVTDPLSRTTTVTYNARGWAATVTDPLSNVTTYTYSPTGKITRVSDPSNGGANLVSITYDSLDRQSVVDDNQGHRTTYAYDAVSHPLGVKDPMGFNTTYVYDSRDRLTTITDPLNHSTVRSYDAAGNQVGLTDALGHTTSYAYDAANRLTSITDPLSGLTTLAYDAANRQTSLTDPIGNRTTWAYDAADRLTTLTDALGTATFAYDNANQLTDKTDPLGRRITYAYDADGRRTNERWLTSGGGTARTVTTTYDAASQVTSVSDPDATLTYTYDNKGRIATARSSGAAGQPDVTLTYGYNAADQRTSRVDNLSSTGRTTYAYDSAQRLTTISQSFGGSAGPVVALGYDAANRLTGVDRTAGSGGDIHTTYAYDSAGNVGTITHSVVGGSSLATFSYAYDSANRLTHETNAEGSVTYSYDNTNQLTSATGARSESYAYDANGNRNATGYIVGTGGTLSASPNATYTYDSAGHVTAKTDTATGKVTTFSYDYRDRLTGATRKTSGGVVDYQVTYTYDALNRRIGEQIDADGAGSGAPVQTWTVFDGENPYADFTGSGAVAERYLYGPAVDSLLARTDASGVTDWYLADRLGSVRDVVDVSGSVVYHTGYDSFGKNVNASGTGGDRFGFTGREHDAALNLYYNRARFYDPATGRFLSRDPIEFSAGDVNLYRYVNNSPINGTDPSGLQKRPRDRGMSSRYDSGPYPWKLINGDLVIITAYSPVDETPRLKFEDFVNASKKQGYSLSPYRPKSFEELKLSIEMAARAYGGQFNSIIIISHAGGSPGPALKLDKGDNADRLTVGKMSIDMSKAIQNALKPDGKLVFASCGYYYNQCDGLGHSLGKPTEDKVKMVYASNLQNLAKVTNRTVLFDPWLSQPSPMYGSIPHKPGLFLNEFEYIQKWEQRMQAKP